MEETQSSAKKQESQTPNQAIVAFIDILGYENLVNQLISNIEAIKSIEKLLKGVSVELLEAIRVKLSLPDPYGEYSKKLFHLINAGYISDTILVTLSFSDTEISFPYFDEREILSHCIFAYFNFIAMTCALLIGKTGHVVRGGISIGPHYENRHNESIFIFSQAYAKAYKLENAADTPRILLDDEVFKLVNDMPLERLRKFAFDDNGKKCLDIYAIFESDQQSHTVLSDIKGRVSRNMVENRQNKPVLRKLIEFAKFHNERVRKFGFDDLAFDLSPVEKHFQRL